MATDITADDVVGGGLILGGVLDLLFAEIPRLLNPNASNISFGSTLTGQTGEPVLGLNLKQSGIIGAIFDGIIIYGGYRLINK